MKTRLFFPLLPRSFGGRQNRPLFLSLSKPDIHKKSQILAVTQKCPLFLRPSHHTLFPVRAIHTVSFDKDLWPFVKDGMYERISKRKATVLGSWGPHELFMSKYWCQSCQPKTQLVACLQAKGSKGPDPS